ncbi:hypothetical protein RvY_12377 [Ramazzottius varieornatus]|uniref:Uncharacterized protein n=1 Tax=Ramazzottius varieornatus TaxID=947166 RepID=A0A1D1VRZ0_RAMVA|nr:hypothetical protein RvY_12377 [Ramazzottius varieornatus]
MRRTRIMLINESLPIVLEFRGLLQNASCDPAVMPSYCSSLTGKPRWRRNIVSMVLHRGHSVPTSTVLDCFRFFCPVSFFIVTHHKTRSVFGQDRSLLSALAQNPD